MKVAKARLNSLAPYTYEAVLMEAVLQRIIFFVILQLLFECIDFFF